ncbi:ribonuclease Z [Novosphingobium sp. Chol11]|uniref:ribonuclease Z n=1 Tax=Novosphingobium sp. Chol11 TaxID=1385763 RepID=UPI001596F1E4|nr:ribonuclease Z [Novosphingobium sp. Chol11]
MRPTLHPRLVNGRFGDPAVFVEALHRRNALLFDLGDLAPLSTRDLLRITHVFVSHTHMDHFIGFDRLLRVHVGREKEITIVGPVGIIGAVGHKLQAYTWDLVDRYATDLAFTVIEVLSAEKLDAVRFRLKARFAPEAAELPRWKKGPSIIWPDFQLGIAILEHHGVSLGFAVQEPIHVNIWRNRLDARGLSPGPWLQRLKRAIYADEPGDVPIDLPDGQTATLGDLRDLATVERGQKIAYVTDVADTHGNRTAIYTIAREADLFFVEASFSAADKAQATARAHLTTIAAGEIARAAAVRRVEPFHFSPRYAGEEARMLDEVDAAFRGDR